MSDLPSVPKRIQVEETEFRAPVSESTMQKFGSTNNYLLDHFPVPEGTIHMFAGLEASVPSGYIPCDGRAISRTTYSSLFLKLSTLWGVGDGLTTFNVPDMRGRFGRGVDVTTNGDAGNDPDKVSRIPSGTGTNGVGSIQTDAMPTHAHSYTGTGGAGGISAGYVAPATFTSYAFSTSSAGNGTDSRPKNVAILWIIKY